MISLAGKAALITGGSRGIGAATVKLFAQAGADVVFSFNRNKEAAAQVEQEARKHGTRIESCKADLGKMADAKKLIDFTRERLGRIDILVANAGIWNEQDAPIEKMTEREWDEMIRVNLKSVYSVIHFTAPHMIAQKSGKIVAISSTAGPARRIVPHSLRRDERRRHQLREGLGQRTRPAQHPGKLRRAGLGGYGHVQIRPPHQDRIEVGAGAHSPEARGHRRRNRRSHSFCRFRPGNLYHR